MRRLSRIVDGLAAFFSTKQCSALSLLTVTCENKAVIQSRGPVQKKDATAKPHTFFFSQPHPRQKRAEQTFILIQLLYLS
ncbi:hypothetical protein BD289DRAFT_95731 [Coniella lustricola]|uniref:Uncharacterized protein n=1 Tax=Coniella lustricola TaxID=2025994 RepID=A0A2T2ZY52_9PEZI|nr:hypothetical protein BD289DRAFT_95731 [Coniella lustricola]